MHRTRHLARPGSASAVAGSRASRAGVLVGSWVVFATALSGPAAGQLDPTSADEVRVRMATDLGDLEIAVDTVRAPITARNFLFYVDEGLYEGGSFYRAVRMDNQPRNDIKIEVIQGGLNRDLRDRAQPPIRLEGTAETGLRHLDGVVSMARAGPDTGRAEFFICIGAQPELDEGGRRNPDGLGFAAFGRVVSGMDVVRSIQARETDGQTLAQPVRILRANRVRPDHTRPDGTRPGPAWLNGVLPDRDWPRSLRPGPEAS